MSWWWMVLVGRGSGYSGLCLEQLSNSLLDRLTQTGLSLHLVDGLCKDRLHNCRGITTSPCQIS
jgi:hypothetical protein